MNDAKSSKDIKVELGTESTSPPQTAASMVVENVIKPTESVQPTKNEEYDKLNDNYTASQLRALLVEEFDFAGAEALITKPQLIAVIQALRAKTVSPAVAVEEKTATPEEVISLKNDEEDFQKGVLSMKQQMEKEPKIWYCIPFAEGDKIGSVETCQINGYRLNIMKGVPVELPKPFVDLLNYSYRETIAASSRSLAENASHGGVLGSEALNV